jgi:hypothetical protein
MSNINFYQVGYTVVVTNSPRDLERQKELRATEVIAYKVAVIVDKLCELGAYRHLFIASGDPVLEKASPALLESTRGRSQACYSAWLNCLHVSMFVDSYC